MRTQMRRQINADWFREVGRVNSIVARTSATHPLRIDCVQPNEGWGLIGLSLCPGKKQHNAKTGPWHRDLAIDLACIERWGARTIISLIEDHEFRELQVDTLPEMVRERGMNWRHLPIRDRYPPGPGFCSLWTQARDEILSTLKAGQHIFIHGNGGLGRTGCVAAYLLIESGVSAEDAVAKVRGARRNAIVTTLQEWSVLTYRPLSSGQDIVLDRRFAGALAP